MKLRSRTALLAEFLALFVALPIALFVLPARIPPIPFLWLCCLYALTALLRDPEFSRKKLRGLAALRGQLPSILALFAIGAGATLLAVYCFAPATLFDMPRERTALWAAVMLLYPLLSVWPQGVIYRAFILQRYQQLLHIFPAMRENARMAVMIGASAVSFSLIHIVFHNWIAVALTLPGGILFGWRYWRTGSHLTASFEHALYGCFLFTVGLGRYFYIRFI